MAKYIPRLHREIPGNPSVPSHWSPKIRRREPTSNSFPYQERQIFYLGKELPHHDNLGDLRQRPLPSGLCFWYYLQGACAQRKGRCNYFHLAGFDRKLFSRWVHVQTHNSGCENIRCLLNHLGECGEVLGFKTGCGPNGNYIVVEFKTEEAAWECLTKPVFCCKGWCMKIRPARIPSEVSQIETFDRSTKSPQTPVPKEKSAKRRRRSRSPSDTTPDRTSKSEHKRHRSSHHRSKRQSTRRGRSPSPDPAPSSSNQRDDPEASSVVVVKEKTTQDAPTPRRKENAASPPPPERATNGPNPVTAAEGTQPAAAAGTHPKSDQQGPILPTSTWPAITSDYLEQFLSSILRQQPNHTGSDQEVMDLTTPELSPPHVNGQTKQPLVYHTDANGQLPYAPAHPDVKVENNEHPSADISSGSTDVDAKDIAERPPFSRNASISLSAFEETLQDMADEGDKSGFVGLKARFCFGCGWKFVSGDRFCALCGKDRRVFES